MQIKKGIIAGTIITGAFIFRSGLSGFAQSTDAIRPFRIHIPDKALVDLKQRLNATKWPKSETVADASQGVQLVTVQKLANYWATKYDWRKIEAKLNTFPQFMTTIDGVAIHFIHVRSRLQHGDTKD